MINMKPAILETARRREEIYPSHVHWLGYDKDYNFLGYYSRVGSKTIQVELEDDEVTPEKIVTALSDLIAERDALKAKATEETNRVAVTKKYKLEFDFFGEAEEVWNLDSEQQAKRYIEANVKTFGENRISNVKITAYGVTYDV